MEWEKLENIRTRRDHKHDIRERFPTYTLWILGMVGQNSAFLKEAPSGAADWLSPLGVWLLISPQIMVLGW